MKPLTAAHTYLSFESGSAGDAFVPRANTSLAKLVAESMNYRSLQQSARAHLYAERVVVIARVQTGVLSLSHSHQCLLSRTHTHTANLFYTLAVKIEIDDV